MRVNGDLPRTSLLELTSLRNSWVMAIQKQLREADGEASVYVADNGGYSQPTITQLNQAGIKWVSRVSETMTEAKTILQEGSETWQQSADGMAHWFSRELTLPQGRERWVVVYTQASLQRAQQTLQRQVSKAQTTWEQKCWHLGNRRFACEADARAQASRELKEKPAWLDIHSDLVAHPQYEGRGRPRKNSTPASHQWQIVATVSINQEQVEREAFRKACCRPRSTTDRHLQRPGRRRAWLSLPQGSALSGFLCLCQETGAHHGPQFHYGSLPAGLPLSRIPASFPLG